MGLLAGGFRTGDKVVSLIVHVGSNGHVNIGEIGIAKGPAADQSAADASDRVNCAFPSCGNIDMLAAKLRLLGCSISGLN